MFGITTTIYFIHISQLITFIKFLYCTLLQFSVPTEFVAEDTHSWTTGWNIPKIESYFKLALDTWNTFGSYSFWRNVRNYNTKWHENTMKQLLLHCLSVIWNVIKSVCIIKNKFSNTPRKNKTIKIKIIYSYLIKHFLRINKNL